MRAPRGSSATSSVNLTRPAMTFTGHRRIKSSSAASSPSPTLGSPVRSPDHASFYNRFLFLALISSSFRLGGASPDSPGRFPSRHRFGECEGEQRRRTPLERPGPRQGGCPLRSSRGRRQSHRRHLHHVRGGLSVVGADLPRAGAAARCFRGARQ